MNGPVERPRPLLQAVRDSSPHSLHLNLALFTLYSLVMYGVVNIFPL